MNNEIMTVRQLKQLLDSVNDDCQVWIAHSEIEGYPASPDIDIISIGNMSVCRVKPKHITT